MEVTSNGSQTPCFLPCPELVIGDCRLRHTNAILRRIAQTVDCGLMGSSFVEEGQVDSWLDWGMLDIEHQDADAPIDEKLDTLQEWLKPRTFLVGQRLTLADVSVSISVRPFVERAGIDKVRKSHPAVVRWMLTCIHHLGLESTPAVPTASKAAAAAAPPAAVAAKAAPSPKAAAAKTAPSPKAAPKAEPKAAAAPAPAPEAQEAAAGGEKASKKEDKKKAKEDAKKAKEEERKRKEEEERAAKEAKFRGPDVTMATMDQHAFGNLFIKSEGTTDRKWTAVKELASSMKDQVVWLRARVQTSRKQGANLCFLTLRQNIATVQAVVAGKEMAGFAGALPDESVVDIKGKIDIPKDPVKSCSQSDVELQVEKMYCIGRSVPLPLQLADAGRSEKDYEADESLVRVGQDTRLDNRIIDLRTAANQAIFRIQSGVCGLFRDFLSGKGFTEIHSPKLIGAASEGGADVFRVDYFSGNAYLAQSPQLYKQMALMADMNRVFEIGPVFRSEKSFTHRHMTEFTGLDLEMTFMESYTECLDVLDGLFNHIFTGLNRAYPDEIEAVRRQFPFEDLKWKYPCLRLTFEEAINILREKGPAIIEERLAALPADQSETRKVMNRHLESVRNHDVEEDISTEDEKVLGEIMRREYEQEFYIIDKFPVDVRPFYTMADPKDKRWTNAYDLFLRGEEITSGAQRIHDPKMLAENAEKKGVELATIQPYLDAFKYGAFPHAGAGIGMERVVMLFLNLNNIRKTSLFPRDPKRLTP